MLRIGCVILQSTGSNHGLLFVPEGGPGTGGGPLGIGSVGLGIWPSVVNEEVRGSSFASDFVNESFWTCECFPSASRI